MLEITHMHIYTYVYVDIYYYVYVYRHTNIHNMDSAHFLKKNSHL